MNLKKLRRGLAGLVMVSATQMMAAPVDLSPGNIEVNGDASCGCGDVTLTSSGSLEAGSAFIKTPFNTGNGTAFSTSFHLRINGGDNDNGADGMTFVIQNDPAGKNALGASGGSIGYEGISKSFAVEFDTWKNGYDPDDNHIGINMNGDIVSKVTAPVNFSMNGGGDIYAWIDYDGSRVKVYINNSNSKPATPILNRAFDINALGAHAYFGFTAGTGSRRNEHNLLSWDLSVQEVVQVPMSNSMKLMLMLFFGAGGLFFVARQRQLA